MNNISKRKRDILELGFWCMLFSVNIESKCSNGCELALGSYYVAQGSNLTYISKIFAKSIPEIIKYNPQISRGDSVEAGTRINVPFTCLCLNGDFLGYTFKYETQVGDTYGKVASEVFANLTNEYWIQRVNWFEPALIPDFVDINVTVNCTCGNRRVSKDYGLFTTYPLRPREDVSSLALESGVATGVLELFNPGANFSSGSGIVFLPTKDQNGTFPPLKTSTKGLSGGATAGICVGAVVGFLFFGICISVGFYRRKRVAQDSLLDEIGTGQVHGGSGSNLGRSTESGGGGITVDKSVEFTYDELSKATDDFNLSNKIGQGGFGVVYYGELRGEKTAIKKMDMQASKEFVAELKVLTHVHHLNLVRLIGYCVEESLFLVYEFIENGNLGQHLRDSSGREPIPWATRVQIALDSARGLQYIHEHTVPVYIHRDIKSPNILLDENFRAKVADFGLSKLTEVGSGSLQTRLVGTFGYMPPEYAQYGEVSPKVDVYAFGVVLLELISAKEAVIKTNELFSESKGLVGLFEEVLSLSDQSEGLCKLVDPRLGGSYPLDSVRKVALLARACTHENPQLRPSMRSIVVALMTLSSSTEECDVASFYEDQDLVQLMSGR